MNSKKEWRDDKIDVSNLKLDLQNPRLPKQTRDHNDVNEIIKYLLEKEDVLKIAKSIANNGYHKSAVTIVCEEKGDLIVLDGNRRLAACQLLLKPELATNIRVRKELELLKTKLNKKELRSVKIALAPSRTEAEKEIWDIHVSQLLKPWQVLQKLRMYRNLIDSGEHDIKTASSEYGVPQNKFKKELEKLYFYENILNQLKTERAEKELLKSGFNKIERLILSDNGKKLLEYSSDNKGNIEFKDEEGSAKKIKKIIPYIINPGEISAQVTQDFLKKNVFPCIYPEKFPLKQTDKKELVKDDGTEKEKNSHKGERSKKLPTGLFFSSDVPFKISSAALRTMYIELRDIEVKKFPNATHDLLRSFLECSLIIFLKRTGDYEQIEKNEKHNPTLGEMLTYVINKKCSKINDYNLLETLKQIKTEYDKSFSLGRMNMINHNENWAGTEKDARSAWCKLENLFKIILKN